MSRTASMQGKVVVITGATSGIGERAAERLAAMGARLVLVARSKERSEATLGRLSGIVPEAKHRVHYADLSLMAETRRAAREIVAAEPRIDVLINNAGALFSHRRVTSEGLEQTFALNHMSYFVLTEGLRGVLAPDARIVNTASEAHRSARFRIENLKSERYRPFRAYGLSKLCNILFTRELARTFSGTGVTVNCLHPGFVASRFFDNKEGAIGLFFKLFAPFAISTEKGAKTLVYLASSEDATGVTGQYFSRCRIKKPTAQARNDRSAGELWKESARLYASG